MEKDVARQIEEQLSAFLDGELPEEELALLVRRLERDQSHRATLDRYALIGGALRNDGDVAGGLRMRRGVMAALDSDAADEPVAQPAPAPSRATRYVLAASVLGGVVAVFLAADFQSPVQQEVAARQALESAAVPVSAGAVSTGSVSTGSLAAVPVAAVPVAAVAAPEAPAEVRLERHQQQLQRIRLKQERMRSYLISHGEHSSPLHGGIADSRMYVQQASYSE